MLFFLYHSLHLHYVSPIDGMASIIFYYMETLDHANLSCLAPFSTYHLMPREKPSEKHLALLPRRRESNPGRLRSKLLRYPLLHHPSASHALLNLFIDDKYFTFNLLLSGSIALFVLKWL